MEGSGPALLRICLGLLRRLCLPGALRLLGGRGVTLLEAGAASSIASLLERRCQIVAAAVSAHQGVGGTACRSTRLPRGFAAFRRRSGCHSFLSGCALPTGRTPRTCADLRYCFTSCSINLCFRIHDLSNLLSGRALLPLAVLSTHRSVAALREVVRIVENPSGEITNATSSSWIVL